MARIDPQVNIRVPQDLKDMLEKAAKENGRSINSETVLRLMESFSTKKHLPNHGVDLVEIYQSTNSNDALLKAIYDLLEDQDSQRNALINELKKIKKSELGTKGKVMEALTGMPTEIYEETPPSRSNLNKKPAD